MIVAPVVAGQEAGLRHLLASMNHGPGRLDPKNALIPFDQFDTLHVARLLLVDDKTVDDVRVYDIAPRTYPLALALLGDVDGDADEFLDELATRAAQGLRAIFSHCEGFTPQTNLRSWMKAHAVAPAASYVNWRGRTVQQVREEAALHDALEQYIERDAATLKGLPPRQVHRYLRQRIYADVDARRLTLSPERPTPLDWRLRNLLHLVGIPLLFLLLAPVLVVVAVIAAVRLRRLEKSDPELCDRCDPAVAAELALFEDHDVSNQFSAMGTLKPGFLRLATTMLALLAIDYAARHVYTRGALARVRTILFARWVFLDERQRVLFISNYDGSLESYMDDFINKVGFGLNVVFSNGIGYPRTDWLIKNGCSDERKFKEYLRRHQMPTQVWYKAYPGLTAVDLERNGRIRQGLESSSLTDAEARTWVALL
jgi:DNA-directed RNA polymerase specialized sigma24 family protein